MMNEESLKTWEQKNIELLTSKEMGEWLYRRDMNKRQQGEWLHRRDMNKRQQGEWIKQYGKSYELITNEGVLVGEFTKCPKCQYDKARGSNFCPNCGAKMIGGSK